MDSICEVCSLPTEICVCEDNKIIEPAFDVNIENRSKQKTVTVVEFYNVDDIDLDDLETELKKKFACGGTLKEETIELQGDHENSVTDKLKNDGFETYDPSNIVDDE